MSNLQSAVKWIRSRKTFFFFSPVSKVSGEGDSNITQKDAAYIYKSLKEMVKHTITEDTIVGDISTFIYNKICK